MLKYCGPKPMSGAFSGGAGEDQFGSFLTREHAAILARQVDLGFDRFLPRGMPS
ncbi:rod-binding protein [Paracoccus sp. NSM]|uniref:rod-binding protein n=1 Tax=Paracoccus sp. NSM TaxID=3457784 RepID=UPI00403620DA